MSTFGMHATSRLWKLLAILAIVALTAPMATLAGQAIKGTDRIVSLYCFDLLTSRAGSAEVYVSSSALYGPSVYVAFWASRSTPFEDPATLSSDWSAPATVAFDGSSITASVPLVDAAGDPAGSAVMSAAVEPDGPAYAFDDRFRDGNTQHRASGSQQFLRITSGSLVLPGGASFPLADNCAADDLSITFFDTNPAARTYSYSFSSIGCALDDGSGHTGFLFLDSTDLANAFVDVFVDVPPLDFQGAFGMIDLSSGSASVGLEVYDSSIGDVTGGVADLAMSISATGTRIDYTLRSATIRQRVRGDAFDVSGSVTFPAGGGLSEAITFSLDGCVLADQATKTIFRPAKAPNPTGKVPSNDLPTGAKAISVGTNLAEQTKNAAYDMEVPFDCLTFTDHDGSVFTLTVIKTLWYKIVGTGSTITIDTAGSAFDTVVAAYTAGGAGVYTPVAGACVDDVPVEPLGRTLQSAISWASTAGVTYYVQIGGFPDDLNWGSLHVSVR